MIKRFEEYINEDYFSKLASRKDTSGARKELESDAGYLINKHRPTIAKVFCEFLLKFNIGAELNITTGHNKCYRCDLTHGHDDLEWFLNELVNNNIVPNIEVFTNGGGPGDEVYFEYEDFVKSKDEILKSNKSGFIEYRFDYAENIDNNPEIIYSMVIFENIGYNINSYSYMLDYELGKEIQKRRNDLWKQ